MSAIYYYRRKTSPLKWFIIILIILIVGGFMYWFYKNYFSKIEINKSVAENMNESAQVNQNVLLNLSVISGTAQMSINKGVYTDAVANTILHQGDKIKTGTDGRVILNLENGSIIRIGENTELVLANTDSKNFLLQQNGGRVYYNLSKGADYQVKTQSVLATALGTKFEIISNTDSRTIAALTFADSIKVEADDNSGNFVIASRLDSGERAQIDLKAAKKDMLKLDSFNVKTLALQEWYKWNFDSDNGLNPVAKTEPKFEAIKDSLVLSATGKDNGIYLAWSVYNRDDFKTYQIIRSETNLNLKYPDSSSLKSFIDKGANSYLDTSAMTGKSYYYRVCVVKLDDNIACGNVVSAQFNQPAAVKDSVPPQAPVLSATISESGVNLTWSKNSDSDFKEYAILHSSLNFLPAYPADKFATSKIGVENYLDKEVNITSVGANYYRVCSIDLSDNFNCSNAASIIDGKIQ